MNAPTSGLIAIVRGITPDEAVEIATVIHASGFDAIEVPLNSPDPFTSIRLMRDALPPEFRVGAGTVLTVADVEAAAAAGSDLIVSPNTDTEVIRATVARGLASYPGVATPSEAFTAIAAGARSIKLFPSTSIGVGGMKAWASVLPADVELIPVGGVEVTNLAEWLEAGAGGAGIGSSLYRAGKAPAQVAESARAFVDVRTASSVR